MPSFSQRTWTWIVLGISTAGFGGSAQAGAFIQTADVVYVSPVQTAYVPTGYAEVVSSGELVPTAAYIYPTTTAYVESDYVVRYRPWWRRARYSALPVVTEYSPTVYATSYIPSSWRVVESSLTATALATTPCGEPSRVTYGAPRNQQSPAEDASTPTSRRKNSSASNFSNQGAGESGPDNQVIRSQARSSAGPREVRSDESGRGVDPNAPAPSKPGDFPLGDPNKDAGEPKSSASEKPVASSWGIVSGRVKSILDNKPIENVPVVAQPYSGNFEPKTFNTNAEGRFSFLLPPGNWEIKVPGVKAGEFRVRKVVVSEGRAFTAEGEDLPRAGLEFVR